MAGVPEKDAIDAGTERQSRQSGIVPLRAAPITIDKTLRPAPITIDKTLRCRHELKYRISESKAAAVEKFIQPYIHPDRFCKIQPTGWYPIVSLYLDSPDLKLCKESLTGKKNRYKLRIRGYSDDPAYPKFFEIKRRINTVILKDRQRVNPRDIAGLLSGGALPPQYYSTEQEALKQFNLYQRSINAGPLVLVRYLRRAYEDDSETRVRITFDRELTYRMTDKPEVALGSSGWQQVPMNFVILEIKFTSRFPAWLSRMVRCVELMQSSFSKYANCVLSAREISLSNPRINEYNRPG